MIATSVTSASPIISADAVVAVRRGLRIAFSRASTPDMPRGCAGTGSRGAARPERATSGLSIGDADEHQERGDADDAGRAAGHASELTSPKRPSTASDDRR